jgi:ElaB/YqjD/DUF883 family membrane-anchored ribosome-binding protein
MYQNTKSSAKDATEHMDNAMADFKSGAKETKRAARDGLTIREGAYDDARERADQVTRTLRDIARDAGTRAQDFLNDKKDQALDAKSATERSIRANPLGATAIAFAGGLVLARLFRRR